MLILTVAASLSVAEEVVIPNEIDANALAGADGVALDEIDLSGVEDIALDEIDLSDVSIGGLAGNGDVDKSGETDVAPFVVENPWKDLQKQIDGAKNGSVVKLIKDVTAQDGDNALVISENKDITLDLNGHVIDRNLSKKKTDGAAIKVLGKLTIKDSSKDHKGAIKNANSVNSGGGIVVRGTGASLTLEYVTISNCKSSGHGGGVYVKKGKLKMQGAAIEKCSGQNGGGVYVNGASVDIVNSTVNDNSAQTGGGVFAKADSITIKNSQILNNTAKADGGGAFIRGGNLTLLGGKVNGNKAEQGSGGGVYADANATKINNRIEIKKNSCGAYGGGVFVKGSKFDLVSCNINGNSAKNGGGVYTEASATNIFGSEINITWNAASECGGGVYTASKRLVYKQGANTEKNSSGGNGAGMYVAAGDAVMSDGLIRWNNSKAPGGGVYIEKGKFSMRDGYITFNQSREHSGGVGMSENGVLSLERTPHITNNKTVINKKIYKDNVNVGEKLVILIEARLDYKHSEVGVRGEPHVFTKGCHSKYMTYTFNRDDFDTFDIIYNEEVKEAELVRKNK